MQVNTLVVAVGGRLSMGRTTGLGHTVSPVRGGQQTEGASPNPHGDSFRAYFQEKPLLQEVVQVEAVARQQVKSLLTAANLSPDVAIDHFYVEVPNTTPGGKPDKAVARHHYKEARQELMAYSKPSREIPDFKGVRGFYVWRFDQPKTLGGDRVEYFEVGEPKPTKAIKTPYVGHLEYMVSDQALTELRHLFDKTPERPCQDGKVAFDDEHRDSEGRYLGFDVAFHAVPGLPSGFKVKFLPPDKPLAKTHPPDSPEVKQQMNERFKLDA